MMCNWNDVTSKDKKPKFPKNSDKSMKNSRNTVSNINPFYVDRPLRGLYSTRYVPVISN